MADAATPSGGTKKALLCAALLCALTVSGCAASPRPAVTPPRAAADPAPPPRTMTPGGSGANPAGSLNATDIGWIQLTIAMEEQARTILDLAPRRRGDAALGRWAADLAEEHRRDLTALRRLLADGGVADDNPHAGHEMPGMASAAELRTLETARGTHFDRLLRSAVRAHLTQTRKMAAAVRAADAGPGVKDVALAVGRSADRAGRDMPPA